MMLVQVPLFSPHYSVEVSEKAFITTYVAIAFLLARALQLLERVRWGGRRRLSAKPLPLPPGPKSLPIVGNLFDLPIKREGETFSKWSQEFGEIVHLRVLGQSIVIVNTAEAAHDLFVERSEVYSDRPKSALANELLLPDSNLGFMPHGDKWRKYRRVLTSKFGMTAAKAYNSIQEENLRHLLINLLDKPIDFTGHLQLHVVQTITRATYGMHIASTQDRFVEIARAANDSLAVMAPSGARLVDHLPIVRHIPGWVPGATIQRAIKVWRKNIDELTWAPFLAVKAAKDLGIASKSFVNELLWERKSEEKMIRECAALTYGAGTDTSLASLKAFILAMVLFPRVQERAQHELDEIVGADKLPTFADRPKLPYISAIAKEVIRWHNVCPQGFPHRVLEEDLYKGYRIPAGSIVIGNTWGILHDPDVYPDPCEFRPERFYIKGKFVCGPRDPSKFAFGYGQRACAGMAFAENTLWITIAQVLATFRIRPTVDDEGRLLYARLEPTSGLISHPAPFKCSITVRSMDAKALIEPVMTSDDKKQPAVEVAVKAQ